MSAVVVTVLREVEPLNISMAIEELGSAVPVIVGVVLFVTEDGIINNEVGASGAVVSIVMEREEDIQNQLGLAIIFSQKIIKYFLRQGNGNLIHISSIQGISAPKFEHYEGTSMCSPIEYSAIKSGIISITKYLSKYYKNKNLRINCISPGGVYSNQPEKFLKNYNKSCNSKGMLNAEDINGTILFLISKNSHYINGQNIVIDDGWSL